MAKSSELNVFGSLKNRFPQPVLRLLDLLAATQITAIRFDNAIEGLAAKYKADGEPRLVDRPCNTLGLGELIQADRRQLPDQDEVEAAVFQHMTPYDWHRCWAGRAYELASCLSGLRQHIEGAVAAIPNTASFVDDRCEPVVNRWSTHLIAELRRIGQGLAQFGPHGTTAGVLDDVLSAAVLLIREGTWSRLGDQLGLVDEAHAVLQGLDGAGLTVIEHANRDAALNAAVGRSGMTQAEAAKLASAIVRREGWLGIKPLARRIGTTARTMRKAVEGSGYLSARRAAHDKAKASKRKPRMAGTGGRQPEPVSKGDVLDQLIAEQAADEARDRRRVKPHRGAAG